MKKHRELVMIMAAIGLSAVMTGCYTQVESARDDRDYGYSSQDRERGEYGSSESQAGYDTTYADSSRYGDESRYGDDDSYDHARHSFYYDSYYPAISYGFGYYDPWWRPGLYVGYGPFGWCGTYDPWYYAGWYAPVFFPGFYGYYHHYYGGNYYGGGRVYGMTRGRGVTRSFGVTRGGAAVYRTPSQLGATAAGRYAPKSTTTRAVTPRGRITTERQSFGRARPSAFGRPSARGTLRGGSRAMQGRPRSVGPPSRGYRDGGNSRGGRSYSPPPSRGGGSPAGRGSSGGSRGSSGGSRGSSGGSRGSSGGSRGGGRR